MSLLVAILLAIFVLPAPWGVVAVGASGVLEAGEAWLWIRVSRRRRPQAGVEALLDEKAVVVSACRPVGTVRVAGELWRARCEEGAGEGETVCVRAVEGLTLVVEPCD
jgi:membrane protein implicated in regulation of membrane protease activity